MGYPYPIDRGESRPLGATVRDGGVNFSLYSQSAWAVELLLFDMMDDPVPRQVIRLETRHNRVFNYWHVFVHGIGAGQLYAYRVFGPHAPAEGMRFDPRKVLLDPYAKGIVYGDDWDRDAARGPEANIASSMKSIVVDPCTFDWQGVQAPRVHPTERVIYELHVRGFTRHPSSGVQHPGTFAGLVEKIPYLKDLGVTTVELLPVFQFDEGGNPFSNPLTTERLRDYWGYNPLGFFAPHRGYAAGGSAGMAHRVGFRDMVREMHRAGLEVFLDVVYNHTAEGSAEGPTLSFRGLENAAYYHLLPGDLSRYENYSGCGNTLNCNHPIVRRLILDSLRYWVDVMHVDGFRFDLASILARDEDGRPSPTPPLTWEIESDPVLERAWLVAEAWDAAGLYQVGAFPGERWAEWNGCFRDDVRRFLRGDFGHAGALAKRLLGSPDLYQHGGREPQQCINFVTAHDGFTLEDLVSYERKHNDANGEEGRDGSDANFSANHGVEGPTDDELVGRIRARQIRSFLALLFLAQGTPMLQMGDECRRTQGGNNNAWGQDNETSWLDWGLVRKHEWLHRFTRELARFRRRHPSLRRQEYLLGVEAPGHLDPPGYTRVRWHGVRPDRPDWSDGCRTLAYTLTEATDDVAIHIMVNAHTAPVRFWLPEPPRPGCWRRAIDTSLAPPEDIAEAGREPALRRRTYEVQDKSVVVLVRG